jgi:hypothetical protein
MDKETYPRGYNKYNLALKIARIEKDIKKAEEYLDTLENSKRRKIAELHSDLKTLKEQEERLYEKVRVSSEE